MKRRYRVAKRRHSRELGIHQLSALAYKSSTLPEKIIIDSLSQEDKIKLYQCIEVAQGIRVSEEKNITLPPSANRVLLKYRHMPTQTKKRYAERIKAALYNSMISAIETD